MYSAKRVKVKNTCMFLELSLLNSPIQTLHSMCQPSASTVHILLNMNATCTTGLNSTLFRYCSERSPYGSLRKVTLL